MSSFIEPPRSDLTKPLGDLGGLDMTAFRPRRDLLTQRLSPTLASALKELMHEEGRQALKSPLS